MNSDRVIVLLFQELVKRKKICYNMYISYAITPLYIQRWPTKRSEHYVNNKEFLYAIVEYKAKVREAEEAGNQNHVLLTILVLVFLR